MEGITLIFDVDGTLCPLKKKDEEYINLIPYPAMLERLRMYKNQGAKIVLFTSRNMNTHSGNLGRINAETAKVLLEWLQKWDVPFDEIYYGKPWPGPKGFYIDDSSVRPDEFMKYSFDELEEICRNSRRVLDEGQ